MRQPPNSWQLGQLGQLFETITGSTPSKKDKSFYGGDVPFVKPPELLDGVILEAHDNLSYAGAAVARVLPPNSILVSCIGNLGKVGLNKVAVAFNQQINAIKPNDETIPTFMLFQTLSPNFQEQLHSLASGTTVPIVNKTKFNSINVVVPPLVEQKRIVAILNEAFTAITTATFNAEKNLANARELFESYSNVAFDSSSGEWTQSNVGELVKKGIIARPLDGNHGEIHPKKADFVSSGVPFIMAADLQNGSVNQDDCNFITRQQADSLRKGFAYHGDVLLSHKGTIGRVAVLSTTHDYVMLTPQVTYYRVLNDNVISNRYLYHYFQIPKFQSALASIAKSGSTRAYIGITKQRGLPIDYPPIQVQSRIVESLDLMALHSDRIDNSYRSRLTLLAELKQSILHKAFTGELTADEKAADRTLSEAGL